MKHQKLLSYVRQAIDSFNMIEDGDKIAIGISGGKDSLLTLIALNDLKKFYPKKFEIEAITVSLGFENADYSKVTKLCKELNVNYTIIETQIGEIVFNERKEKNPCSLCAKMRKGALNNLAEELGCNKIALGHNKDDFIETFFMSLFFEGRISTIAPVSYLEQKKLYSIRPLVLISEKEIRSYVKRENIDVVKSPCPVDGKTKREEIKNLIKTLSKDYDNLEEKVFGAIKRSNIEGWND